MVAAAAMGAAAGLSTALAGPVAATHDVSSTNVVNCTGATVGPAPHGLWTRDLIADPPNECGNYFDINPGATFQVFGDGTGRLQGTASNPQGLLATFLVELSDFVEVNAYKQEGGAVYDSATDTPDIDFFRQVVGAILIDGVTYNITGVPAPFAAQFGPGANAKDPNAFGFSAWLLIEGLQDHWDFNFNLEHVPAPSSLILLAFGMAGLGFLARRRRYGPRKPA